MHAYLAAQLTALARHFSSLLLTHMLHQTDQINLYLQYILGILYLPEWLAGQIVLIFKDARCQRSALALCDDRLSCDFKVDKTSSSW